MPSEPDNKMDELLKAYAEKRRAEAGGEMHPATRRLLQAEVAKLRPAPAPERTSWLTGMTLFWPRVAVAAAVVIAGGIAVMSLFPPAGKKDETYFLAKLDKEAPSVDRYKSEESQMLPRRFLAPAVAPPAKPADQPTIALADETKSVNELRRENAPAFSLAVAAERDLDRTESAEKRMKLAEPARAPAPIEIVRGSTAASGPAASATQLPVSEPVSLGVAQAESKDKAMAGGRGVVPQTPLPNLVSADGAVAADYKKVDALAAFKTTASQQPVPTDNMADSSSQSAGEMQQRLNNTTGRSRFAQVQSASQPVLGKTPANPEPAVLTSFFVEQNGDQVRVVDGDGSIYEGRVLDGETDPTKAIDDLTAASRAVRLDDAQAGRKPVGQQVRQQQAQRSNDYQESKSQSGSVWSFRASGTNRTLKQPVTIDAVVYEGALVTNVAGVVGAVTAGQPLNFYRNAPGQAAAQQRGYTITTAPAQAAGGAALQNNAYNNSQSLNVNNALRIQGTYRVGPTNQRSLDAVPDRNQP